MLSTPAMQFPKRPIPAQAGVGLKPQHFETILETNSAIAWFEIHPENYMGAGGPMHYYLSKIRESHPLSLHSVGMSLGSADGVCDKHLQQLKNLIDRYEPALMSDHLSWSRWQDVVLNDLLPMPYTIESLKIMGRNIDQTQNSLQRQILIENPSSYFEILQGDYDECGFLIELVKSTGAGILLDINNIFVSANNHRFDAKQYIDRIPSELVGEIHLAGHSAQEISSGPILIDDHGSNVCDQVWALYEYTLDRMGQKPTLIEWDTNIPEWPVLMDEADKANSLLAKKRAIFSQTC